MAADKIANRVGTARGGLVEEIRAGSGAGVVAGIAVDAGLEVRRRIETLVIP